jgi:hypothetical protein
MEDSVNGFSVQMEKPQGAAISSSLRTLTRVPSASGDTAAPLLFLVQSEQCTAGSFSARPEII